MYDKTDNSDIFTPKKIAKQMLNQHLKFSENTKMCLEPSCGKGNILEVIYQTFDQLIGFDINQKYIEYCDKIYEGDFYCEDFLFTDFDSKFKNIIMNPPYIKIQNLKNKDKIINEFGLSGNCDIYHAFILKCLQISDGIITAIIPNSFLTNKSAQFIRDQIKILDVINFDSEKVFEGIDVYTCIITFKKEQQKKQKRTKQQKYCHNGIATLGDKYFIYQKRLFDEPCWKQILKVSKNKINWCIYPYDDNQKLLLENDFQQNNPKTYKYIKQFKQELNQRDGGKIQTWYQFGRTQSLKPVNGYFISTMINEDFQILKYKQKMLFYSGLHINYEGDIQQILEDNYDYIYQNSIKRSNDWISISGTTIDQVLNYE